MQAATGWAGRRPPTPRRSVAGDNLGAVLLEHLALVLLDWRSSRSSRIRASASVATIGPHL